jgi:CRISPR-associated protein Cmr5
MNRHESSRTMILRDQQRALHAYQVVGAVPEEERKDYEIVVNAFGANILRGGLCAALAVIQRRGSGGARLLDHLATAGVPGVDGASGSDLFTRVRTLDAEAYVIASREMLHVAAWLKRAVQATFEAA